LRSRPPGSFFNEKMLAGRRTPSRSPKYTTGGCWVRSTGTRGGRKTEKLVKYLKLVVQMSLQFVTLLATIWWRSWKYFGESHVVFHETGGLRGRRRCSGQCPGAKLRGTIAFADTVSDVPWRITGPLPEDNVNSLDQSRGTAAG